MRSRFFSAQNTLKTKELLSLLPLVAGAWGQGRDMEHGKGNVALLSDELYRNRFTFARSLLKIVILRDKNEAMAMVDTKKVSIVRTDVNACDNAGQRNA